MATDSPSTVYLVVHDLPGASGFDRSGAWLIRQLWMWQEMKRPGGNLSSGIILAFRDQETLARQDARYILLFSEACRLLRAPFTLEDLRQMVERASVVQSRAAEMQAYIHPGAQEVSALETGLQHRIANLLGAFTLLRGAYVAGDLEDETWRQTFTDLKLKIERELGSTEPVKEYLASRGYSLPEVNEGALPSNPDRTGTRLQEFIHEAAMRKGPHCPLHILLVDNEAHQGWFDTLRCLLDPAQVTTAFDMKAKGVRFHIWTGATPGEHKEPIDLAKIDLVLLDLRIDPRQDEGVDREIRRVGPAAAREFSGMRILRAIREQDQGLPVIMLSASKKFYTLDIAKKFGNVWFLSKEPYLPGELGIAEPPDRRAEEHYREFRKCVIEALDWKRQNVRRLWHALEEFGRSKNVYDSFAKLQARRYIEGAIRLAHMGVDHADGQPEDAQKYYGASILNVAMAATETPKKIGRELEMMGRAFLREPQIYALGIAILRDAAAHAFGSNCINFYDVLAVFQLFFLMTDCRFTPYDSSTKLSSDDLIEKWIIPSIESIWENYSPTIISVDNNFIKQKCSRNPLYWRNDEINNISDKENVETLRRLHHDVQIYIFNGKMHEHSVQLLLRYMQVLLIMKRFNARKIEEFGRIVQKRFAKQILKGNQESLIVFGPIDNEVNGMKLCWIDVEGHDLLKVEKIPLERQR